MRKQLIAAIVLAGYLTIVTILMLLAHWVDIEVFFVLSLLGFLMIIQLIQPRYVQSRYIQYIRYLIGGSIVIFGVIVAMKVMKILGLEIVI
jgi:hypothetical protein